MASLTRNELLLAYLFTVIGLGLAGFGFLFLPKEIPLWYSLAVPEQQLVPKIYIWLFPGLMVLVSLFHSLISKKLIQLDQTLITIFAFGTTLVTFLLLVGLIHIIYIFL